MSIFTLNYNGERYNFDSLRTSMFSLYDYNTKKQYAYLSPYSIALFDINKTNSHNQSVQYFYLTPSVFEFRGVDENKQSVDYFWIRPKEGNSDGYFETHYLSNIYFYNVKNFKIYFDNSVSPSFGVDNLFNFYKNETYANYSFEGPSGNFNVTISKTDGTQTQIYLNGLNTTMHCSSGQFYYNAPNANNVQFQSGYFNFQIDPAVFKFKNNYYHFELNPAVLRFVLNNTGSNTVQTSTDYNSYEKYYKFEINPGLLELNHKYSDQEWNFRFTSMTFDYTNASGYTFSFNPGGLSVTTQNSTSSKPRITGFDFYYSSSDLNNNIAYSYLSENQKSLLQPAEGSDVVNLLDVLIKIVAQIPI